jgi:hypothetical protein
VVEQHHPARRVEVGFHPELGVIQRDAGATVEAGADDLPAAPGAQLERRVVEWLVPRDGLP